MGLVFLILRVGELPYKHERQDLSPTWFQCLPIMAALSLCSIPCSQRGSSAFLPWLPYPFIPSLVPTHIPTPSKVECITSWEPCSNVKDVQAFLGFANFYRRFIKNFSRIISPLVQLTKKAHVWDWSARCTASFKALKAAFTSAPTLRHFDPEREVWVETDASDYVSSGILSQKDDQGILHPVAFMSKKYDPAECNYEIYDKVLTQGQQVR